MFLGAPMQNAVRNIKYRVCLTILTLLKNPKNDSTGSYFGKLSRTEKSPMIATAPPFVPSINWTGSEVLEG